MAEHRNGRPRHTGQNVTPLRGNFSEITHPMGNRPREAKTIIMQPRIDEVSEQMI